MSKMLKAAVIAPQTRNLKIRGFNIFFNIAFKSLLYLSACWNNIVRLTEVLLIKISIRVLMLVEDNADFIIHFQLGIG